jgi:hypothetical protein
VEKREGVADKAAPAEPSSAGAGLPPAQLVVAASVGIVCLGAGAVATFVTSNGAGSATLIGAGLGFVVVAFLGNRVEFLKFGGLRRTSKLQHSCIVVRKISRPGDTARQPRSSVLRPIVYFCNRHLPRERMRKYDGQNLRVSDEWRASMRRSTRQSSTRVTRSQAQIKSGPCSSRVKKATESSPLF